MANPRIIMLPPVFLEDILLQRLRGTYVPRRHRYPPRGNLLPSYPLSSCRIS
jgi:hypothetical protein